MTDALTPLFAVAAIVLCVAGLAKLRSPATATRALHAVRLPAPVWAVRALALAEIALGM